MTTAHLSHWVEAAVLVVAVVALGVVAFQRFSAGRTDRAQAPALALLSLLSFISYVLFLVASLTFFDASTRIDDRILSPLLPLVLLVVFTSLGSLLPEDRRALIAAPLVALALWAILPRAWGQSNQLLSSMREEGAGFSSRAWQQSETLVWMRALPAQAIVYTDEPAAVGYLASRETRGIPQRYDPVTMIPRPDYAEQIETMRSDLRRPSSALVIFTAGSLPDEAAPMEDLTAGLILLASTPDAEIYVDPENPEKPQAP